MKNYFSSFFIALFFIAPMGEAGPMAHSTALPDSVIPGQYIVVFKDGLADPETAARELAHAHGLGVLYAYSAALKGFAATIPAARLTAIQADPRVAFISEDREVLAAALPFPTGVDRIQGDASSTRSGDGKGSVSIGVAILDTGIDLDHPDLNVVGGVNCSSGRSFDDFNGHGTHVAGTVAAKDDGVGVVGVAPGASLYSVRVLNRVGSGNISDVVCGVDWVTANASSMNIKVANMSLGGSGSDDGNCGRTNKDALHLAICNSVNAGITYVVAAMNSNADFASFVPAAYDEVLTVTAMADFDGQPGGGAAATCLNDVDDTSADFSNFTTAGSSDEGHTIAGPGVCILSTWKDGIFAVSSGTSMATPHVTGTAALCISTGRCSGSPADVISKLRSNASVRPSSYGFVGDPNQPISSSPDGSTLYYGYLVYAGGF